MNVIGLDIGRSELEVVGENYMDAIPSVIGEYRELKSDIPRGKQDIVMEFEGQKWLGGTLAIRESEYAIQDSRASKIHENTRRLAVMGMHRAVEDGDQIMVVTGEPIGDHVEANKAKLRQMLEGPFTATLNDVTKSWCVRQCVVTAEGAVSVWGLERAHETLHIIDAGSRKTNYAVTVNRGLIDRLSGTLDFGCETVRNMKPNLFADMIAASLSRRWLKQLGPVVLIGGMAEILKPELERHYNNIIVPDNPRFANARGMYEVGVRLNAKVAAQR